MKKSFFFFAILFWFMRAEAQTESFAIVSVQAGTANLNAAKVSINLNDEAKEALNDQSLSASYYVVFTPHDGASAPSIADKNNSSFSVIINKQDRPNSNNTVDYVVFLKRKMIQLSTQKNVYINKPPGN